MRLGEEGETGVSYMAVFTLNLPVLTVDVRAWVPEVDTKGGKVGSKRAEFPSPISLEGLNSDAKLSPDHSNEVFDNRGGFGFVDKRIDPSVAGEIVYEMDIVAIAQRGGCGRGSPYVGVD